jgi:formylmethanofuran dehydrogenase subunit C
MPLILTSAVTATGPLAIDLQGIVPDRVSQLEVPAIERLAIRADGRSCALADLFRVEGDPGDGVIECRGDFSRVHRLAAAMSRGHIKVLGDVGRHAAAGMSGGRLDVAGHAGDFLAAELAGGEVHVAGTAGDNAAAALAGSPVGMRGGIVVVAGAVGCLAGARMRRGILAIGAGCGAAPAFEMRAGTVIVAGAVAGQPGLGMRRGSLVMLGPLAELPTTFHRGAAWRPAFLPLLLARLHRAGFSQAAAAPRGPWRQWHGDMLAGGGGEILVPA